MPGRDLRHRSVDALVAELLTRVGRLEQSRRLSYTDAGAARFANGIDTEGSGDVSDPAGTTVTPDPVQSVTLTPGADGAELYIDVDWTLPATMTGVHAIVVRVAKVNDPGGGGETVETADRWETEIFGPVRIRALEPSTTYDVTVLTANAVGTLGNPVTARDTVAAAPATTADAADVTYDDTGRGWTAADVQAAIDTLDGIIDGLTTDLADHEAAVGAGAHVDQQPAIADLAQVISAPPTQAEVQAISDKVDAILAALRAGETIAT